TAHKVTVASRRYPPSQTRYRPGINVKSSGVAATSSSATAVLGVKASISSRSSSISASVSAISGSSRQGSCDAGNRLGRIGPKARELFGLVVAGAAGCAPLQLGLPFLGAASFTLRFRNLARSRVPVHGSTFLGHATPAVGAAGIAILAELLIDGAGAGHRGQGAVEPHRDLNDPAVDAVERHRRPADGIGAAQAIDANLPGNVAVAAQGDKMARGVRCDLGDCRHSPGILLIWT